MARKKGLINLLRMVLLTCYRRQYCLRQKGQQYHAKEVEGLKLDHFHFCSLYLNANFETYISMYEMTKLLNFDYCLKSCLLCSRYSACGFVYENISVYLYLFQTQLPSQITILRPESQKVTQWPQIYNAQNIISFLSNPTFVHTCMHTVMCSKS